MTRLTDRSLRARSEETPVNPMDSVANLADAMLVLAVGIMVLHGPDYRCGQSHGHAHRHEQRYE